MKKSCSQRRIAYVISIDEKASDHKTNMMLLAAGLAIEKGSGAYNLACISALQHDEPACREWLELAYELNSIPEPKHLNADSDLDNVRETGWFKKIVTDMM